MYEYLGIDQSLRGTGLARVARDGRLLASTTLSVGSDRGAVRLRRIRDGIREFVGGALAPFAAVAREGFSVNSQNRPFDLGMCAGVVDLAVLDLTNLEVLVVPPMSLKKFAGAANTSKDAMVYAVKKRWDVDLDGRDDEADAAMLAAFARAQHIAYYTTRAEADAVRALTAPKKPRLRRASSRSNI